MIDLQQYKKVCVACDKILEAASGIDEVVSIPLLHVLREHPQCLNRYNFIFNKQNKIKSQYINLLKKFIELAKSTFFDFRVNIPLNLDKDKRNLIIVSHITNPNQCSNLDDEYFGSLQYNLLESSNIQPILLLINQTSWSSKKLQKKLYKNKINRIVIPKSSGFFNEIRMVFSLLISVSRFIKSIKLNDTIISSVLNTLSNPSTMLSGMSALRIGFFVEKYVGICNPNYILTTYEGHSRERIIFSSARKINKNILCYAYQHTILNKYQHALVRNINEKYNPDHIFCSGQITFNILSKLNSLNAVKMSILGSPKGLTEVKNFETHNQKYNLTFLFLPEGIESEYQIFFKFILDCSHEFPNFRFIWRSHPILDLESLDFFNEVTLPSNIIISKNIFDEDLKLPNIAIYRGTNAIIRAVMNNLVPIYLKTKGEIGIDIMHNMEINRISSISELRSVIKNNNLLINKKENVQFCKDYFMPLNYKSLLQTIDENES